MYIYIYIYIYSNLPILEQAFRALTGEGNSMTFPMLSQCFENQQRQMPPERVRELFGTHFTCFTGTGTNVPILT